MPYYINKGSEWPLSLQQLMTTMKYHTFILGCCRYSIHPGLMHRKKTYILVVLLIILSFILLLLLLVLFALQVSFVLPVFSYDVKTFMPY